MGERQLALLSSLRQLALLTRTHGHTDIYKHTPPPPPKHTHIQHDATYRQKMLRKNGPRKIESDGKMHAANERWRDYKPKL